MSVSQMIRTIFNIGLPMGAQIQQTGEYTEDHLHNRERWAGLRAPVTGTQAADYATLLPFQLTSGNNTWGFAQPLFKSADTPYFAGNVRFDFHRVLFTANSSNTVYRVRIIWDQFGSAAGIAAGTYTEFMYFRAAGDNVRKISEIKGVKIPVTWLVFGQCWNLTNLATLDCFFGTHEYPF